MYRSQHKAVTFDCNFTLFIFIKTQHLLHATILPHHFISCGTVRFADQPLNKIKGHNKICHFPFKYKLLTTDRKCA